MSALLRILPAVCAPYWALQIMDEYPVRVSRTRRIRYCSVLSESKPVVLLLRRVSTHDATSRLQCAGSVAALGRRLRTRAWSPITRTCLLPALKVFSHLNSPKSRLTMQILVCSPGDMNFWSLQSRQGSHPSTKMVYRYASTEYRRKRPEGILSLVDTLCVAHKQVWQLGWLHPSIRKVHASQNLGTITLVRGRILTDAQTQMLHLSPSEGSHYCLRHGRRSRAMTIHGYWGAPFPIFFLRFLLVLLSRLELWSVR
ncbi:hypothetical protein GGI35DRAFT_220498 [Trichoderma velutinum]